MPVLGPPGRGELEGALDAAEGEVRDLMQRPAPVIDDRRGGGRTDGRGGRGPGASSGWSKREKGGGAGLTAPSLDRGFYIPTDP